MSATRCCEQCGAALPPRAPGGLCPKCLLAQAVHAPASPEGLAVCQPVDPLVTRHSSLVTPSHFGDYELLEKVAEGGMGVVYRARQLSLNRIVAVKMIQPARVGSPEMVLRFRAEAEAAASLHHPNIVPIHETGECEGQHYFSMDYIEGQNLAEAVREGPLPSARAAQLLEKIAAAVHYAHQHKILHRDLKPSNVILDEAGEPHVTDFGLAKRLTSDLGPRTSDLTLTGQVFGSPRFMPPEQASGRRGGVGVHSDVYGLGAILYYLLTARPPFVGETMETTLAQVLEQEPVSPRLLNASVPRDLETICLKCLEKEPSRRYASAQAVADELGRFLRSEPILARPVGLAGKAGRWCRRKPALATAMGAVILVAAAGFVGILSQWHRADAQRDAAVQARIRSDQERYDAAISEAQLFIEQNRPDRAREILAREGPEGYRGWEWGWLQRLCNLDLMTIAHSNPVMCVAFSPDGRYLFTGSKDVTGRLFEVETGRQVREFRGHRSQISRAAFSMDGKRLLTAGNDGTARIWDPATAQQLHVLTNGDAVYDAVFSPNGELIATAAGVKGVKLWDAGSGAALPLSAYHERPVQSVSFRPDGGRLAYAEGPALFEEDAEATVRVLDLRSGEHRSFKAHRRSIRTIRFSPDGKLLATAGFDGTARLWDSETGAEVRPLQAAFGQETIFDVEFSPDGHWLAVAGVGWSFPRAQIFEVASGRLVRTLAEHSLGVTDIVFSGSGTRLATAGYDRVARVWSAATLPEYVSLEGHDQTVWTIAFSPDGRRLASGSFDQTARVWDTETGSLLVTLNVGFPVISLAFSPEGKRLVTVAPNHTAKVWNATNGQEVLTLSGHTGTVMTVAWNANGRLILTGSKDGTACLWDATTGAQLRTVRCHTNWVLSVAFSPDSRHFATAGRDGAVRIWEAETGRPLHVLPGHGDWVQQVVFSPDGRHIATGSADRKARLWDSDTGRLLLTMEGHRSGISSLVFSPDGARLATAGAGADLRQIWATDHSALIWDLHTGKESFELDAHRFWVVAVAFSPEGKRLATGSMDNTVRIREAFPWKAEEYPGATGALLGDRVEAFKRRYWQKRLTPAAEAVSLGARSVKAGRHWQSVYVINAEMNLPVAAAKTRPAASIPARDPQATGDLIDLTTRYNEALAETWQPAWGLLEVDRNLSSLPAGVHRLAGVPFDVRGIIRLRQSAFGCAIFPTQVEIAVARKFRRLHVLHGADSSTKDGTQIGSYRLHYREGVTRLNSKSSMGAMCWIGGHLEMASRKAWKQRWPGLALTTRLGPPERRRASTNEPMRTLRRGARWPALPLSPR
jgi:WD40 repeat protein